MQPAQPSEHGRSSSISGRLARASAASYEIGGVMVLAAVVVLVVVSGEVGFSSAMAYGFGSAIAVGLSVLLIKAGVSVVLLHLLYRWSASRDRDRERQEDASRYFDEHGTRPDGAVPAAREQRPDRHARGRIPVPVPLKR